MVLFLVFTFILTKQPVFFLNKNKRALFAVVIEDDRIDEVLKGMTDKSSPGV